MMVGEGKRELGTANFHVMICPPCLLVYYRSFVRLHALVFMSSYLETVLVTLQSVKTFY